MASITKTFLIVFIAISCNSLKAQKFEQNWSVSGQCGIMLLATTLVDQSFGIGGKVDKHLSPRIALGGEINYYFPTRQDYSGVAERDYLPYSDEQISARLEETVSFLTATPYFKIYFTPNMSREVLFYTQLGIGFIGGFYEYEFFSQDTDLSIAPAEKGVVPSITFFPSAGVEIKLGRSFAFIQGTLQAPAEEGFPQSGIFTLGIRFAIGSETTKE